VVSGVLGDWKKREKGASALLLWGRRKKLGDHIKEKTAGSEKGSWEKREAGSLWAQET